MNERKLEGNDQRSSHKNQNKIMKTCFHTFLRTEKLTEIFTISLERNLRCINAKGVPYSDQLQHSRILDI